jgi:hypothetical protein
LIGSVANIQSFINGCVYRDYLAFFNAESQQKHQELKRTLLKGLFEPLTPSAIVLSPSCLANDIDITHVIFNINLWHGNSLIL